MRLCWNLCIKLRVCVVRLSHLCKKIICKCDKFVPEANYLVYWGFGLEETEVNLETEERIQITYLKSREFKMMWNRSMCFIFLIFQICIVQNVNAFHQTGTKKIWDVRPLDMSPSKAGRFIVLWVEKLKSLSISTVNFPFWIISKKDINNVVDDMDLNHN